MELIESTGDGRCDKIVQGLIGIFDSAFPGRVRGFYLRGSHASGTPIAGSDLDLFIVFKDRFTDQAEYERARELSGDCARLTPMLLEIVLVGERGLHRPEGVSAALNLKLATRLLYGEDIRPALPPYDADTYLRSVIHTPLLSYSYAAQRRTLVYPLQHIDPDGEFFGFDQWTMPGPDGLDQPSTKLLIGTVGWTATAIIALRSGEYVRDKAACVALYQQHVADEWTDLVTQVHDLCRNRWHYQLPTTDADRHTLRSLCAQALNFQNHFLPLYRDYQLTELTSTDPDRRQLATHRLQQITFPDR
ncbi:nucleotidyltransferase-like protein [Kribbella antiqua]|uniref:Nucleotidyltransferase-like protein n=1 Tax=Kribbella antiqua TaxID=2512217 RepID=A0A4R2IRN9_9ACTN|nr:nucleotidyltransferase domain-containing protein [Kribbella antiqua]TCO47844.1 nucleotidyltransferase-like protein [Kribbella antiqua]